MVPNMPWCAHLQRTGCQAQPPQLFQVACQRHSYRIIDILIAKPQVKFSEGSEASQVQPVQAWRFTAMDLVNKQLLVAVKQTVGISWISHATRVSWLQATHAAESTKRKAAALLWHGYCCTPSWPFYNSQTDVSSMLDASGLLAVLDCMVLVQHCLQGTAPHLCVLPAGW